jgi:3-hydroxyacyl-[acyl-carrier-protein] dehydratase
MRFLFVDRIDHLVRNRHARGRKTISFEEGFLQTPSGRPGEFPRLLVLEAVAQLAAWLVLYSTDFERFPVLARFDRAELGESIVTGDRLDLAVEILSIEAEGAYLRAEVARDGRVVGRGENCLCALTPLDRLADRDAMRATFKELTRHAVLE